MTQLVTLSRPGKTPPRVGARGARVLLVSPRYYSSYFPIGLAYISSYIRQFGHEVTALNLNHFAPAQGYERLAEVLREQSFDAIGITGITVAFAEIERMVAFIRPRTEAPIVLGGGITSCESELVMTAIRPDFMVVSEGELIFRELLDVIMTGGRPAEVRGIWYWDADTPRSTGEGAAIPDLDDLPFPDLATFGLVRELELQSARQISYSETRFHAGKTVPITASRSCPFRCTFCYHAGMGKYRRHSIPKVVDHIESILREVDASHLLIYDELFSASKARIVEFCDLLEARQIKVSWFCQLRVDQLDLPLLRRMRAAGCRHVSYGFESGSDVVLESMDKKITASEIARAVTMTREAQIGIQANFLFGDPAETEATLQESLSFQREHDLKFVDWSAVIPYPGTRLYQNALDRGLIADRLAFMRAVCDVGSYLWRDAINLTSMSDAQYRHWYVTLRELNDRNHRSRPTVVLEGEALDARTSRLTLQCQHCGEVSGVDLPYPPGLPAIDAGRLPAIDARTVLGVPGYNLVCDACNRKSHLAARRIPHVGRIYAVFQAAIDALAQRKVPVVLLPAMDRYLGVVSEDVALGGLEVVGVLDSRPERIGVSSFGRVTELLEPSRVREILERAPNTVFVILPWVEFASAKAVLREAGASEAAILCWNEVFVAEFSRDDGVGRSKHEGDRPSGAEASHTDAKPVRRTA